MKIEYVRPEDLKTASYNPRTISRKSLRALAALLDAHGFVNPLVARREDGLLIGGHQRLRANAMRKTPDAMVPVVFLEGLSDERAKAVNLALNNPAAQGRYDKEMVGRLLEEIEEADLDAAGLTGFTPEEARDLVAALEPPAVLEEAPAEPVGGEETPAVDGVVVILEMTCETYARLRGTLDAIVAEHELTCHVRMGDL